jgi:hypothetical protein
VGSKGLVAFRRSHNEGGGIRRGTRGDRVSFRLREGVTKRAIGCLQLSDGEFNDADSYFADPSNPNHVRYTRPRPVDERGYVVRRSVMEEGTRPEYVIPVSSSDGVWGMVKRVGRFNAEGWLALFQR